MLKSRNTHVLQFAVVRSHGWKYHCVTVTPDEIKYISVSKRYGSTWRNYASTFAFRYLSSRIQLIGHSSHGAKLPAADSTLHPDSASCTGCSARAATTVIWRGDRSNAGCIAGAKKLAQNQDQGCACESSQANPYWDFGQRDTCLKRCVRRNENDPAPGFMKFPPAPACLASRSWQTRPPAAY